MKKITSIIIMVSILILSTLSTFAVSTFYNGHIKFYKNNSIKWIENPILNRDGRTFVSLRDVANIATSDEIFLSYDDKDRKVTMIYPLYTYWHDCIAGSKKCALVFYIDGTNVFYYEGENLDYKCTYNIDASPFIENGRTYVPIRFICEQFGWNVYFYKGDIYAFDNESDEWEFNQQLEVEERREKRKAVTHDGITPYDMYGVLIQKYDRVCCGGFYGTVYDIDGDKIYVYWDECSILFPIDDIDSWSIFYGVEFLSFQWLDAKEVSIKN